MKRILFASLFAASLAHSMPNDLDAWAKLAKAKAIAELKDPASVQFRNLYVSRWKDGGVDKPVLCGELNAKNSMGGYVGFHRFVADEFGAVVEGTIYDWDESCTRRVKNIR